MEGPNWHPLHGSVNSLIMPDERRVVGAHHTLGSSTRRSSIIISDLYMPNTTSMNLAPEPPFSSPWPSNPLDPSTSLIPSFALSSLPLSSLASLLSGTFVEVAGPCFFNTRGGQHEVYSLSTGSINCFRDSISPFHWFGIRNGDLKVEHFDWNFQQSNHLSRAYVREIMTIYKILAHAFHNHSGRHTNLSVNTILSRILPSVDRHLYSNAMAHSTVHILFDFPFLERRLQEGWEILVKVVITIEFYQAPWRAGFKRWHRRASLNVLNVTSNMPNNPGGLYTFLEFVAIDPLPNGHIVQSQVASAVSSNTLQQTTVLPTTAFTNLGPPTSLNVQPPVISPPTSNSTSQGSQTVSTSVPSLNFGSDSMMTGETIPCYNNVGIDLSPSTSSGTETSTEPCLPKNKGHFGPLNPQGLGDVQSGSSASSSFQQDTQLSFMNGDFLAADASAMLLQTPGTDNHQTLNDPASSFQVIDNNDESRSMVVSNPQGDDISVVNPDTDQPVTTPTNSARRFPCPYPDCTKLPFTRKGNLEAHLNTHLGVTFPCPYIDCGKIYRRHGDRHRHIEIVHKGCFWRCVHCLKVHVRKPTLDQLFPCTQNEGGFHVFDKHG